MRTICSTVLKLTAAAVAVLVLSACAAPAPSDSSRATRNQAGQSALEGMENSVLKDNNPDTSVKAKPPN
jgi:hypothetical protein